MKIQTKRIRQKLNEEQILDVLNKNTSGVLSLIDENNHPYGVPLNYTYYNGKLLFHTSKFGYKIELIKNNPKCCFTIIDQDEIVEEEYTSLYRSVIIQGNVRIIDDKEELMNLMNIFTDKFVPMKEERQSIIKRSLPALCMLEIEIKEISGKCALDLTK